MNKPTAEVAKLERAYKAAVLAEERAKTVTQAQCLAVKTERCLTQLKLAKINRLPAVAKKVARRLDHMLATKTYAEVVDFISGHHYGGCACGCGVAVTGLFKQGHDMKLKNKIRLRTSKSVDDQSGMGDDSDRGLDYDE